MHHNKRTASCVLAEYSVNLKLLSLAERKQPKWSLPCYDVFDYRCASVFSVSCLIHQANILLLKHTNCNRIKIELAKHDSFPRFPSKLHRSIWFVCDASNCVKSIGWWLFVQFHYQLNEFLLKIAFWYSIMRIPFHCV